MQQNKRERFFNISSRRMSTWSRAMVVHFFQNISAPLGIIFPAKNYAPRDFFPAQEMECRTHKCHFADNKKTGFTSCKKA